MGWRNSRGVSVVSLFGIDGFILAYDALQIVATKENPDDGHDEAYKGIHDDEQRAWRAGCLVGNRGMSDDGIDRSVGSDERLGILLLLREGVVGVVFDLEFVL